MPIPMRKYVRSATRYDTVAFKCRLHKKAVRNAIRMINEHPKKIKKVSRYIGLTVDWKDLAKPRFALIDRSPRSGGLGNCLTTIRV